MRSRLSKILDITTQLDGIATELESFSPKVALALDKVSDKLENRNAIDLSKLPEALQNVLKGIKMPSSIEQAKMMLKRVPKPGAGPKNAFDPTALVQLALGGLMGMTFIPLALKGTQMLGQTALESMISAVKALKEAKNPIDFLKAWKAHAMKLNLDPETRKEFENSPAFMSLTDVLSENRR